MGRLNASLSHAQCVRRLDSIRREERVKLRRRRGPAGGTSELDVQAPKNVICLKSAELMVPPTPANATDGKREG